MHRLNVIAAQVSTSGNACAVEKPTRKLNVRDTTTGKEVSITVDNNCIKATDLKQLGLQSFDPGYMNTTCCVSRISFIDGGKGILRYRGVPIEVLAEKSDFVECAFLIMRGELPTKAQLMEWKNDLMSHSMVHSDVATIIRAFRYDAHPMGMFISAFAALGTLHPEQNPCLTSQNIYNDQQVRNKQICRIMGNASTIAAMVYRHRMGRPFNIPNSNLGYVENFLYMMDTYHEGIAFKPHPKLVKALDTLFLLHAEHELNCSTSAMRHLTSSGVDVYTAIAAAAGALYGPKHGGANEAVIRMLEKINNVDEFIQRVKEKKERLMGFGHRVYRAYDPRAKIVKRIAEEVFEITGRESLIEKAMELERKALGDEYFVSRKLYPNVDFYSGLIYKAMGFPTDFYPILFAVPRIAGWLAHWSEFIDDPDNKIYRPFQIYKGKDLADYVPVELRTGNNMDSKQLSVKRSAFNRRRDAALSQVKRGNDYDWNAE
jgi:citrate synthase